MRWEPSPYVHVDAGVTAARFASADDTDAAHAFIGAYAVGSVGYRYVFVSSRLRGGAAAGDVGAIVTPVMLRVMVPW